LIASFAPFTGCRIQVSQVTDYGPEVSDAPLRKAVKRNDLICGVKKVKVLGPDGEEADEEAGDGRDLGALVADAVADALIFKRVVYPLRDEKVDVVLEPTLTVEMSKNRFTNAVTVFPGLILPWVDGLGFDYDHAAVLEVKILNANRSFAIADTLSGEASTVATRYPSILWWLGLHAGLFVLMVFETVSTDVAVLEKLSELSTERAVGPVVERLVDEFEPAPKPCPDHPNLEQPGRFCIKDRRDLFYPILRRGAAKAAPKTLVLRQV
jgi:hypothetical protein